MKAKNLMTAIAIVLVVAAFPAWVAAQMDPTVKVNIPFSFRAGDTLMPAGAYRISQVTRLGKMLRIEQKNDAVMLPAGSLELRANSVPKLVFRHYGDSYFLAQIWMADRWSKLSRTKLEREYAERFPAETAVILAEK